MKLKKRYIALYALCAALPAMSMACPTCVGRVQENSNATFFHEDESVTTQETSTNTTQNEGGAS